MRLLLDTHLLVWAMGEPERLPAGCAAMLEDPSNNLVFSVASLWELVIKQALGRPDFNLEPSLLRQALLTGGWQELPIEASHALAVRQVARIGHFSHEQAEGADRCSVACSTQGRFRSV